MCWNLLTTPAKLQCFTPDPLCLRAVVVSRGGALEYLIFTRRPCHLFLISATTFQKVPHHNPLFICPSHINRIQIWQWILSTVGLSWTTVKYQFGKTYVLSKAVRHQLNSTKSFPTIYTRWPLTAVEKSRYAILNRYFQNLSCEDVPFQLSSTGYWECAEVKGELDNGSRFLHHARSPGSAARMLEVSCQFSVDDIASNTCCTRLSKCFTCCNQSWSNRSDPAQTISKSQFFVCPRWGSKAMEILNKTSWLKA